MALTVCLFVGLFVCLLVEVTGQMLAKDREMARVVVFRTRSVEQPAVV